MFKKYGIFLLAGSAAGILSSTILPANALVSDFSYKNGNANVTGLNSKEWSSEAQLQKSQMISHPEVALFRGRKYRGGRRR